MSAIKLLDFPFCNLTSVCRFLDFNSFNYTRLSSHPDVRISDTIILPGVGTFAQGMMHLADSDYIEKIKNHAKSGGKIIGICLGMQLLLSESDESPGIDGLSIIPGKCIQLLPEQGFIVPHIGWNSLIFNHKCVTANGIDRSNLEKISSEKDFYFVHSYVANPRDMTHEMLYFSHPNGKKVAALCKDNVIGFQFHPEKSGPAGYELLKYFLK